MASSNSFPFREHTIAADLKGGYQVTAVDLNNDGKKDLIALGSGMSDLVWFENPGWQRHVMATGFSRMINLAPIVTGKDGIPDLLMASEFSMEPTQSVGKVWLLRHKGDPRDPWTVTEIDRLPASHRLRTARIDESGPVVINAPLAGAKAASPDYRDHVPIVLYRPGSWRRELISDQLQGALHGIAVVDWDADGRDDLLTASFEGIHLFRRGENGRWNATRLAEGNPEAWPKSGSSDIALGRLGKRPFFSTIEPWHGNQVVVYRQSHGQWRRTVIDDSFDQGHALNVTDLNGDGLDEIIAGCRGKGSHLYIYSAADEAGEHWNRMALDDAIPAAACDIADLNGDGRPDIACIGGQYLKLYENLGIRK